MVCSQSVVQVVGPVWLLVAAEVVLGHLAVMSRTVREASEVMMEAWMSASRGTRSRTAWIPWGVITIVASPWEEASCMWDKAVVVGMVRGLISSPRRSSWDLAWVTKPVIQRERVRSFLTAACLFTLVEVNRLTIVGSKRSAHGTLTA